MNWCVGPFSCDVFMRYTQSFRERKTVWSESTLDSTCTLTRWTPSDVGMVWSSNTCLATSKVTLRKKHISLQTKRGLYFIICCDSQQSRSHVWQQRTSIKKILNFLIEVNLGSCNVGWLTAYTKVFHQRLCWRNLKLVQNTILSRLLVDFCLIYWYTTILTFFNIKAISMSTKWLIRWMWLIQRAYQLFWTLRKRAKWYKKWTRTIIRRLWSPKYPEAEFPILLQLYWQWNHSCGNVLQIMPEKKQTIITKNYGLESALGL